MARRGRIGGHSRAARYSPEELTGKARATFRDSFREGHTCSLWTVALPADLPEGERVRRSGALRQAHYARLQRRSALARKQAA